MFQDKGQKINKRELKNHKSGQKIKRKYKLVEKKLFIEKCKEKTLLKNCEKKLQKSEKEN